VLMGTRGESSGQKQGPLYQCGKLEAWGGNA
jgi:hypothetical protein